MSTVPRKGIKAAEPLVPEPATIIDVIKEGPNIRSFRLIFDDPGITTAFSFAPGQIGLMGIPGVGESTFAISSPPSQRDYIQFSVMKTGFVTSAIHELAAGDAVAVRAPLGCGFPVDSWKGKNILIVGGGIGMAPLRSLLMHILDRRKEFGSLRVFYGARTPADLCFAGDRVQWENRDDIEFIATVDEKHPGWSGHTGLVPQVIAAQPPAPENAVAVTCGPPVMIKYTLAALQQLGFTEAQIYTTLERKMKCGIGLCGRCNIGAKYVCIDGPVFSLDELKNRMVDGRW